MNNSMERLSQLFGKELNGTLDCVVIGAGVAGMTSAINLMRANVPGVIIEKGLPGGQVLKTAKIENVPGYLSISGSDFANNIFEQTKYLNIPFESGTVIDIVDQGNVKLVKTDKADYLTKTVVIATGRTPKTLGMVEEEQLIGKGVSYCAICDGPMMTSNDVAVIGDSTHAAKEALYLSNICRSVTIISPKDKIDTSDEVLKQLETKENIGILYNTEVIKLNIEEEKLSSIDLNDGSNLKVTGLFIYVGMEPVTDFYKSINPETEDGYLKVNAKYETSIPGIFACGDIIKKSTYQITSAMGDATVVAASVQEYINKDK